MRRLPHKLLFATLALAGLAVHPCLAADSPADKDWVTEVAVAPGAMTWTSDNLANKKHLIGEVAGAQGKACTDDYAFLGWAPGNGGPQVIVSKTKESYEKAGYTVEQRPGSIDTDVVWIARRDPREAVILWSPVAGSTIYLSCLTAGGASFSGRLPITPIYLGLSLAAAFAALVIGAWLWRRQRTRG